MDDQALVVALLVATFAVVWLGDTLASRTKRVLRAWWRRKRKTLWQRKPRLSKTSRLGVYVYDVIDPTTQRPVHGKVGEGVIASRLNAHRTSTDIAVRHIVRTETKADAVNLQNRVLDALNAEGLLLAKERTHGQGVELFYSTDDAYRIIDDVIKEKTRS